MAAIYVPGSPCALLTVNQGRQSGDVNENRCCRQNEQDFCDGGCGNSSWNGHVDASSNGGSSVGSRCSSCMWCYYVSGVDEQWCFFFFLLSRCSLSMSSLEGEDDDTDSDDEVGPPPRQVPESTLNAETSPEFGQYAAHSCGIAYDSPPERRLLNLPANDTGRKTPASSQVDVCERLRAQPRSEIQRKNFNEPSLSTWWWWWWWNI